MKCGKRDLTKRLILKAGQSCCRYKIAAIGLDYRGKVIASTTNRPRFPRPRAGTHAEMALMRQAPKSLKTIVIARINKAGDLLPIDPCEMCQAKADELGVTIRSIMGGPTGQ